MKKLLQNISLVLLANVLFFSALAQAPCMTGWRYRKTMTIANSGIALSNHQISVVINTQALVALNKVRLDGGDIRFTDASGNTLSYWYDPTEFNTSNTTFWIKANVAAGASNLYMFYGHSTSPIVASGEATFEFFDTFNTGSISPLTWDKCGSNANLLVVGGNATFQSNNGTSPKDFLITTKQAFTTQVIAEAKVNNVTEGRSVIGLVDALSDGYVTAYEGLAGQMKMMKDLSSK